MGPRAQAFEVRVKQPNYRDYTKLRYRLLFAGDNVPDKNERYFSQENAFIYFLARFEMSHLRSLLVFSTELSLLLITRHKLTSRYYAL